MRCFASDKNCSGPAVAAIRSENVAILACQVHALAASSRDENVRTLSTAMLSLAGRTNQRP